MTKTMTTKMMKTTINEQIKKFEYIYEKLNKKVHSYFSLCFNNDLAEDLTQQVFLKVWIAVTKPFFEYPQNLKGWVFAIAVNVKNDYLRLKCAQPLMFAYDDLDEPTLNNIDLLIDKINLKNGFEKLKKQEKIILLLKAEGHNSTEIGAMLNLSPSTVRSKLAVAKNNFLNLINDK